MNLRIEWESGHAVLNVELYFPTTAHNSSKIARLIACGCTNSTIKELLEALRSMEERCQWEIRVLKCRLCGAGNESYKASLEREIRMQEVRQKRIERDRKNIERRIK